MSGTETALIQDSVIVQCNSSKYRNIIRVSTHTHTHTHKYIHTLINTQTSAVSEQERCLLGSDMEFIKCRKGRGRE